MKMDVEIARGYIMLLMVFMQNIHVFNCRSEKQSAFKVPIKKNKLILFLKPKILIVSIKPKILSNKNLSVKPK